MALTLPTPRYQEMVASCLSELALPDLTRLVEIGCGTVRLPLDFTPEADRVRDACGRRQVGAPCGADGHIRPGQRVPAHQNSRTSHPAAEPALA